ncbi:MAG: MFS transporter [Dehalococcoidia bacterium]|nr:MFS transporter [Dehalococcoidia bacterium]
MSETPRAQPLPTWSPPQTTPADPDDSYKWKAFAAIAVAFVTMVASMSMVFVGLSEIADDFGITLRAVSWVVIAQGLTISALMMPMGRLADIIGRRKVHLIGLVLFGGGAVFTALAPTFGLLITARVVTAIGNSMGQSVGTAMVISVFPSRERGKAIGSQTTAVAIGGASGPIIGGLMLQWLPWEAMFWALTIPIGIAFVAGYFVLDENRVSQNRPNQRPSFDWLGAVLSGVTVIIAVILINNPFGVPVVSPLILGGAAVAVMLFTVFVWWELKTESPMLELRMFQNLVFSMALATRFLGFLGTTAVRFLMPIYLISLRSLEEAAAGGVLFLTSLGMGIAAQSSGRLGDRFGERPFAVMGFVMLVVTSLAFMTFTSETAMWLVMVVMLVNGLAMGLWNVPNNSIIMGAVPRESFGVIGALTNLTRNVGNVTGQAIGSAIVVGVMASEGFDIPLSEIGGDPAAGKSFVNGWRMAYIFVTAFSLVGLFLSIITRPKRSDPDGRG